MRTANVATLLGAAAARAAGRACVALALCWCAVAHAAAPVTRCDRIGANPADPDRVSAGVHWGVLDGQAAREACAEALRRYPDEPRLLYQYGRALSRLDRYDEAVPVLSKAAEYGHLIAYMGLGSIYHFVTVNYSEAASWYRQGAELGSAGAQTLLGDMYRNGEGFAPDPKAAIEWYRKAAVQGYSVAQQKLGYVYETGAGVRPDPTEAVRWYTMAAENDEPIAQFQLARMMVAGAGIPRDPEGGARWMTKAAVQGYGEALIALARMHRTGDGVTADDGEAFYWYVLATRHRERAVRDAAERGIREICEARRARAAGAADASAVLAWCCAY